MFKGLLRILGRSRGGVSAAAKRAAQAGAVRATAGTAQAEISETARDVEKSVFFKSFPRPRIIALRASDVDHDVAKAYASKARKFFSHPVNLFGQDTVFYEESEGEYIESIYGNEEMASAVASDEPAEAFATSDEKLATIDEEDRYYVGTLTRMRHTTNNNTATYFLWLLPIAFILGFAPFYAAFIEHARGNEVFAGFQIFRDQWMLISLAGPILAMGFASFSYFVSYKNQQIRNAQNFNGYIETRLNRINTIRADALKEAANAEKEKTNEAEVLSSAVDWMLCYHWMIWRSFLNEHGIRNILFQIRRNTDLYKWGGLAILITSGAVFSGAAFLFSLEVHEALTISAAAAAWFMVLPYFYIFHVCIDPAKLVERKMYASEWARFHTSGIDKGLEDQIRRDKGEILHYRNRLKNESF
ncbi:hypothetical protein V0U79_13335 [Hyphobacterium sp. HN65]|uniref:Uncharacterized protein n=1 Tax=Hyphobacterium lacteum TaxID=3116575 RepID=A0ABU7LTW3_9PROT|nr:hypothetical protein [Hyphobacterium sp. HN65]MEE2527344.1 hypothetical protein [Hyphobacterium sp. HN65]